MELIINLVYIYIAIFSVYVFVLALRNLFIGKSKINETLAYNIDKQFLCVVIYTHNQIHHLEALLNQLKKQDYKMNNFQIYVIADNCTDGTDEFLSLRPSINTMILKEGGLIGKDATYSILLEKLIPNQDIYGYVFLDVEKYVNTDLLTNINYLFNKSNVLTGATVYQPTDLTFKNRIKRAAQQYTNHFYNNARALLGLCTKINPNMFAIKKSLIDSIGSIDISTEDARLKFNMLLTNIKNPCMFNPHISCYAKDSNIERLKPRISTRMSLFTNSLKTLKTLNFKYIEFVFSLISPNVLIPLAVFPIIIAFSLKYYFFVSSQIVITSFLCLVIGFMLSLVNADLRGKEYLYLLLYPFYLIFKVIGNLPVLRIVVNNIRDNKSKNAAQKYTVNVTATIRKKTLPCKLELIVQNDMSKVIFKYRNKKFTTSAHLRMNEAIKELVDKLREYHFTLNICQCCKYFTPIADGTQMMLQGACNYKFAGMTSPEALQTLLWNHCEAFEASPHHSIIEEIAQN